jgi:hypothetical protein
MELPQSVAVELSPRLRRSATKCHGRLHANAALALSSKSCANQIDLCMPIIASIVHMTQVQEARGSLRIGHHRHLHRVATLLLPRGQGCL